MCKSSDFLFPIFYVTIAGQNLFFDNVNYSKQPDDRIKCTFCQAANAAHPIFGHLKLSKCFHNFVV